MDDRGHGSGRSACSWLAALLVALGAAGCGSPDGGVPEVGADRWWKGNLHTHSLWSDGDQLPEVIVEQYRHLGYHFLALSDHNVLAEDELWLTVGERLSERALAAYVARFGGDWVDERSQDGQRQVRLKTLREYRTLFEEPGRFLLLQSEELTDRFENKPVHVNANNIVERIRPQGGTSVLDVMQRNVDAVLEQRRRTGQPMFPHINHPNYGWAVRIEDLVALRNERFFEIYNGHPLVQDDGDEHHASTERMWDVVLAERLTAGGDLMYGLAVDDAHAYNEQRPDLANAGRGWVVVRASSLVADELLLAMERGDFYASTGVTLRQVRADDDELTLEIAVETGVDYLTRFIGTSADYDRGTSTVEIEAPDGPVVLRRYSDEIGVVLSEVAGPRPSYRFRGDELYVRAKVVSSRLKANARRSDETEVAWTQPVVPGNGP